MKKAQATMFVIMGIVVLALIGILLYLSTVNVDRDIENKVKEAVKQTPNQIDIISSFIEKCTSTAISKSISSSMQKAGYFQEEYPENIIYFEGTYYITAIDSDYDYVYGLPDEENGIDALEIEVEDALAGCAYSAYYNFLSDNETFDIFLNNTETTITNASISIKYAYSIVLDNETKLMSSSSYTRTNMYYFINKANYITQEFIESYDDPDPVFNEDLCEATYSTYGYKPEYPLDFMLKVNTSETRITLGQNFFLITLYQGKENLTFAAKPEPIDPIC